MKVEPLVVVGASAGGVEALRALVGGLPPDLGAPVLVVLHLPAHSPSVLPSILSRAGPLPAAVAEDGEPLRPGRVYVAASDRHLEVADGAARVTSGPKESGVRPAIDVLFRSAAAASGRGVVAVVLSGTLDDGSAGLLAVRRAGGVALVQDPDEALYASMPRAAIAKAGADETASAALLGPVIERRVAELHTTARAEATAAATPSPAEIDPRVDRPSPFSCPDCSGVLWQSDEDALHFRCRVGHAWPSDALLSAQNAGTEDALWSALRLLQERADLCRRLATQARGAQRRLSARRYEERAVKVDAEVRALQDLLAELGPRETDEPVPLPGGADD